MLPSIHWDDIKFFLEVHRCGSLSAAGKRLRVSHTTVARHVERLEKDLDIRLFDKTDNGFFITEDGKKILTLSQQMEDVSAALVDCVHASGGNVSGSVRIGAPDGFGNSFLSRVLPSLQREQPGLDIELVPVPITHKLSKRDVDIAVSLDRPETGRIVMRKLIDYDLRLYGSKQLLDETGMPESREDLANYNFVGYVDDLLYTDELDFNKSIHPDLRIAYKGATVKAQYDAVMAGTGLGVLPCFMAADGPLVPILTEEIVFRRTYWLLISEQLRNIEKVRVVADFIVEATRNNAAIFNFSGT